eukprot:GHUV01033043.1.p2 GENE.GHUV01033043.1~~GHUV01033043.1.p2  ORF type:complete len:103 (-),score=28.80 GHUV01033043.1:408-716(-)
MAPVASAPGVISASLTATKCRGAATTATWCLPDPVCRLRIFQLHVICTATAAAVWIAVVATQHNELEPPISIVPHTGPAVLLHNQPGQQKQAISAPHSSHSK